MANLGEVTYRFSTETDYDAIRNIDTGLGSQMEYIIEKYTSFLKKPSFFGAVAELNGEVIAFGAVTLQMEGTKLYCRSGRVKERFRNNGIYGQIGAFFRRAVRTSGYPDIKVEEFTTHDTNPSLHKLQRSPDYRQVFERPFLTFELTPKSQAIIKNTEHRPENVREIGLEGLKTILENKSLRQSLFPVRVFVGFVTFEPVLSELELIADYHPYIVASLGERETDVLQMTIGVAVTTKCYVIQWIVPSDSDVTRVARGFGENLNTQLRRMREMNSGGWCMIVCDRPYKHVVEKTADMYGFVTVEPWSECFVGFVAFGGAYVHHSGEKIITKGGRVKDKWRGKGIYGRLQARLQAEVTSVYPNVKTREFFTGSQNPAIQNLIYNKKYKEIFRQAIVLFRPGSELKHPNATATDIGVHGLAEILKDPSRRTSIFPDKIFVVWEMYDPDVNEIEDIVKIRPCVLLSTIRSIDIVTVGGYYESANGGLIYVMQCHAPYDADVTGVIEALLAHIPHHVTIATSCLANQCTLVFVCPHIHRQALQQAALDLGLEKIPFFEDTLIGYSCDLN
ncbi:uncharacterized protein LOC135477037 [Liolophura sinensis]|uniref:uncharacterized protein LOC135477037 n=1 Tax=Liolophura sinensis TaxID=3198878 RepID=UPI003157FD43